MNFTDAQKFRIGRAILNWSQKDLAAYAGITIGTIYSFEAGIRKMHPNNKFACLRAFTDAGIIFNDNTVSYDPVIRPTPKQELVTHD